MTFGKDGVDLWDWLQFGIDKGFCTDSVCNTHDAPPLTTDEADEFDEGYDPCIPVIRLWLDQ